MDQEIKKKWVDALRNGKYEQGMSALRVDNTFCCLGVLCDIVKDDVGMDWQKGSERGLLETPFGKGSFRDVVSELPLELALFVGLDNPNPDLSSSIVRDRGGLPDTLAILNDAGFTFSQIADLIEHFF